MASTVRGRPAHPREVSPLGLPRRRRDDGIDIGVHRSDRRGRAGKLTRQGSPQLRWALYEAALPRAGPAAPTTADYLALKARGLSHTRASLTIVRKLARRSYHVPGPDPDRMIEWRVDGDIRREGAKDSRRGRSRLLRCLKFVPPPHRRLIGA
jgi:hypothetical protein